MACGVAQGPAIGAAMRAAEEAWIKADFPLDRVPLSAIVDAAIAATNPTQRQS